jgi:glycosyltransferase involved in cell wall biosynthesis
MTDSKWRNRLRRVTGAAPDQVGDQAQDDAELLRRSVLFDAGWYLAKYPNVAAAHFDPAQHYATQGGTMAEGRDPGPRFSTLEYLRLYPDVAGAGANALVHYERRGRQEGRLLPAVPPAARVVLAVSTAEAAHFRGAGCSDVRVLGNSLVAAPAAAGFAARSGFLFVGRLEEADSPNADSIHWFVLEIMPRLDQLIGADYGFDVVGRCAAALRDALQSERVRFHGRVMDTAPFYACARAFVAPNRYAAGIPHKVHEAAASGLPVVATRLLAGQLGWTDAAELLEADTADEFAGACSRLYLEPALSLWAGLREGALAQVARDCDPLVFSAVLADALDDPLG